MTLRTNLSVAILGVLGAIACGPTASGGEGEGESGTSDPTDPTATSDTTPVTSCFVDGVEHPSGEEFESADGCATLRCEEGIANVIDDGYTTVQGDLTLATQPEVEALACLREVTGNLTITGTASDVSGLVSLYRVGGGLEIRASALTTLVGLGGIAEVGASLVIADNESLTTLAFAPYMSVFGDATIQNNDVLASLAGAEFLAGCSGCIKAPPMGAAGARDLEAADGAEPAPAGDDEGGLTAGDEAPGGGTFYGNILIADNDVLVDITVLSNLWFAWADLRLRGNLALADVSSLGNLSEVRGALEISGHPALDDTTVQTMAAALNVWGERVICGNGAGAPC